MPIRAGLIFNELEGISISKSSQLARKNRRKEARTVNQDTNYYLHIGVKNFNSTHTSAVEAIVLMQEALEEANNI